MAPAGAAERRVPSRSATSSFSRAAHPSSRSFRAGSRPTRCPRSGRRFPGLSSAGCSRKAPWSAAARRSTRSIPASITPKPPRRRPICRARGPAPKRRGHAPRATSRWSQMEAISKQDYTDARRAGAAGRRGGRAELGAASFGADQPALHPRAGPDQRPHRPFQRDRRGARHRQPGRRADHHHAARPGLCRHPGIGRGPARAAAGAEQGGVVPTSRRSASSCPTEAIMVSPAPSNSAR